MAAGLEFSLTKQSIGVTVNGNASLVGKFAIFDQYLAIFRKQCNKDTDMIRPTVQC